MAKAKPIPIAITNCAHTHTAQQTLRIRHVAHSAIGNINSDFAKFEYRNQVELWQTWPARQHLPLLELWQKYVACQVTPWVGRGEQGQHYLCIMQMRQVYGYVHSHLSESASHMSFKWTFGHYNKQSPKNIAWVCLGSAQSQASDKLKGRLMNGLCK